MLIRSESGGCPVDLDIVGGGMGGVLPLYVLLKEMRRRWEIGDRDGAVALARVAAPYLHGKAPLARPGGDLAELSDEELEGIGRGAGGEEDGDRDGSGGDDEGGECGGGEAAADADPEEPA